MLQRWRVPKTIQWVINLFLIYLLIFTLFRLATFFAFHPADISTISVVPSFLLGLRYDLRWISILLLPVVLTSLWPSATPFSSERTQRSWILYMALVTLLVFFFFGADFGHFAYVSTRLNASALNFVEDAKISMTMLWQSYPLGWISIGLICAVLSFAWLFRKTHWKVVEKTDGKGIPYHRKWFISIALIFACFIYGGYGSQPLQWKDAFVFNDNFKSYLSLNPLQNFFTTLRFRKPVFDEHKARNFFPVVSRFLQLPPNSGWDYSRIEVPGSGSLESKPNVVLVICESFSMYKSSMSGNPLNATPFMDSISREGIFFDRCFTPHFGTARGVFALLTGIPDVQLSKFSSRNPEALDQHTIINGFEGYRKLYFIGGSSEFNNFKGVLSNIQGLDLYEEGRFRSPKLNVWGIGDRQLFAEAGEVLAAQEEPFFAIIQTADNHRPYTIPEEDKPLLPEILPEDTLQRYGFESAEEYQAFCYMDLNIRRFIESAQKEKYFSNTIFVFIGDHGVAGNASAVYPKAWTEQRLSDEHVPLLYYAPHLLQPERVRRTVSQIDVLPTLAGMMHQPYLNTTLGRDVLKKDPGPEAAFIIHHDEGKIGIVSGDYYYIRNIYFPKEELIPLGGMEQHDSRYRDSVKSALGELTMAIYETGKYMLLHNQKQAAIH